MIVFSLIETKKDCVMNSNQLRQDLKVTEEKLQRNLRGTIFMNYVKLVKLIEMVQQS